MSRGLRVADASMFRLRATFDDFGGGELILSERIGCPEPRPWEAVFASDGGERLVPVGDNDPRWADEWDVGDWPQRFITAQDALDSATDAGAVINEPDGTT